MHAGGCRLDMVLVSEHIQPELLWAYPYNALRNHAVLRAATDVRPCRCTSYEPRRGSPLSTQAAPCTLYGLQCALGLYTPAALMHLRNLLRLLAEQLHVSI